jgi:hypothetical protein
MSDAELKGRMALAMRIGIDKMLQGRSSVLPGILNSILVWSSRLIPRRMAAVLAYRTMTMR